MSPVICEHAIAVHVHEGWKTTLYLDDPGYSGKNLERPGMQALIQEVKAGRVDVVVAYKLDRITRYLPDFYEFWKILNEHKANFVSATQSFDTGTPMGMLMLNMLLSFGQFEREMIAERVSHKIAERAKKGLWNGGWVPDLAEGHHPLRGMRPPPHAQTGWQEGPRRQALPLLHPNTNPVVRGELGPLRKQLDSLRVTYPAACCD